MIRIGRMALALVLAATALPAVEALSGAGQAFADEKSIDVGTELMATTDVTLHKAEISKGSRVSVTKLTRREGRVDEVSVALADGHVVKVTMAQVHTFFQIVED